MTKYIQSVPDLLDHLEKLVEMVPIATAAIFEWNAVKDIFYHVERLSRWIERTAIDKQWQLKWMIKH